MDRQVRAFAAAVVHELRTPLTALSGEVELALRRERSPAEYRDALGWIADRVADLVDLTGDLALLCHAAPPGGCPSTRTKLVAAFASLTRRYDTTSGIDLVIEGDTSEVVVAGDEQRLTRALALLVEHAVKHRRVHAPGSMDRQQPLRLRDRSHRHGDQYPEHGT